jgi:hypothetical protein
VALILLLAGVWSCPAYFWSTNAAEQVHSLTSSVSRRMAARNNPQQPLPPILVLKSTVDTTVSNDALVDRLILRLAPNRHEMVLFDINRFAAIASLLRLRHNPFYDYMERRVLEWLDPRD